MRAAAVRSGRGRARRPLPPHEAALRGGSQFPIQRYVDAMRKPRVPERSQEHDAGGTYTAAAGCTNPLFAARLPASADEELCRLARGPRSPSLVYFAVIGASRTRSSQRRAPTEGTERIDWTPILGRDPASWDETGIDPHTIESTRPRVGLPPPMASGRPDPIVGREWTTGGTYFQYACIFDLYERGRVDGPHASSVAPVRRECPESERRIRAVVIATVGRTRRVRGRRPRCSQARGKAYPSCLAGHGRKGPRGTGSRRFPVRSSSPVPIGMTTGTVPPCRRSPRACSALSWARACRARSSDATRMARSRVSCSRCCPDEGTDSECERYGLAPPAPQLREQVRHRLRAEEGEAAARLPIREVPQIRVPSGEIRRDASASVAFCYSEAPATTRCAHALTFTKASEKLAGARFTMQCIQQDE